jgi:hypothetical protein
MVELPAPPVTTPDPDRFFDDDLLPTLYKALGIALVVQWFVPWVSIGLGTAFSWDLVRGGAAFAIIWSLLGGAGLITLGFLPEDKLAAGIRKIIAAGIGLLGVFGMAGFASIIPPGVSFFGFFGWFGAVLVAFALLLWVRRGYSSLAWVLVIAGLGSVALWLLVPIDGELPLIWMFKVFGASGINIVWRIFYFVFSLLLVGLAVLTLLAVVLKKEQADAGWLRLLAWAWALFVPVAVLLLGVMGVFTSAWLLIAALHVLVLTVAFLVMTLLAGSMVVDELLDGTFSSLLK